MAKKITKKLKGTRSQAMAVAAMKLVARAIESEHDLPALEPGSFDAELTIAIQGDVTIGNPGGGNQAADLTAQDLLSAVLAVCSDWYTYFDVAEVVGAGVSYLADGHDIPGVAGRAFDLGKDRAIEIGLTKTTAKTRGKVGGRPFVRVSGSTNDLDLEFELGEVGEI